MMGRPWTRQHVTTPASSSVAGPQSWWAPRNRSDTGHLSTPHGARRVCTHKTWQMMAARQNTLDHLKNPWLQKKGKALDSGLLWWLRLHVSKAVDVGLIPGWETKIPHALWCGQKST